MTETESGQLVGTYEIDRDYGVPRHRVSRFMKRGLWPAPYLELRIGGIWRRADVERTITRLKAQGHL